MLRQQRACSTRFTTATAAHLLRAPAAESGAKFSSLSGFPELISILSAKFTILSGNQREEYEISSIFAINARYLS
jgi:hypothetical protein